MSKQRPCGCIDGYYWCSKHDIYTKQDRKNDPRWTGEDECSCHIVAPCSYCVNNFETNTAN